MWVEQPFVFLTCFNSSTETLFRLNSYQETHIIAKNRAIKSFLLDKYKDPSVNYIAVHYTNE